MNLSDQWLTYEEFYLSKPETIKNLMCSPDFHKSIQMLKISGEPITEMFGMKIKSSPLLPFEIKYDACLISTQEEVEIPSGEWIHAIVLPEYDPLDDRLSCISREEFQPPAWSYTFLKNYWGIELAL